MKSDVQKPVKDDLINITLKASMGISHVTKTPVGTQERMHTRCRREISRSSSPTHDHLDMLA